MTQEDKELLLRDLCGRLPYGVKIYHIFGERPIRFNCGHISQIGIYEIKPYLRSISSMTFEEYRKSPISRDRIDIVRKYRIDENGFHFIKLETFDVEILDWLNAHHFDYRGLIPKGLAIEVTEENNPYKN